MSMPGFTADASLATASRHYRARVPRTAAGPNTVISQLGFSRFPGARLGGVLGTWEDYLNCRNTCALEHSACLDTCEGTWASPKGSINCTLCDQDYARCLQGCGRDIA